jgi:hypothetical protein
MSASDVSLTRQAEACFQKAQLYPWFVAGDNKSLMAMRDMYGQAVRGLIESRRGNLKALQETSFFPAFEAELRPVLDTAIEEAKHPDR